ncbi:similar to Saccharomyces cerevisiae YBR290W BSD2 Heavy metal ion homeostasis protein [Maudiozyma saulgeensis]|uniref:Similar to Saccharomyces cerevisiae YBR290W BSD2 Heavy metal ion homeostasis protein n=1 Tax=Maudiozyma saulgeensis TaxID=1789683 RepID=A0A1X7QWE8_9SACH|nr:similar to Saccharomyces cerevisiae YBR290W BSD2 Heavy metal ion homeostasis protein [Kazachstania saulgeensis]
MPEEIHDNDATVNPQQETLLTSTEESGTSIPVPESNNTIDDIGLDDNDGTVRDLEMNRLEDAEGSTSGVDDGLLPQQFRARAARQIDNIGRHFNILDRVFRRRPEGESTLAGIASSFDGVFSNLTAKPDNNEDERNAQNDALPSYDEAAADNVPSYYGMDLSNSDMYVDEICIEGLPVGNAANLFWNIIVSSSFQFVGFLITYILHTSHAAKQGSRFGLGLTFIGYAYSMIPNNVTSKIGKYKTIDRYQLNDPNSYDNLEIDSDSVTQDHFESSLNHGFEEEKQSLPTLAVLVGILGAFITIKSFVDYIKVKRMERRYVSQDRY